MWKRVLLVITNFVIVYTNNALFSSVELEDVQRLLKNIHSISNQFQQNVLSYPDVTRVIVLGDTGSGKSTVVHALVRRITGQTDDIPIMVNVTRNNVQLDIQPEHLIPNFLVRGGGTSVTKEPSCYYDGHTNLVYWDCPGFMDTGGVYNDVATLFAIERLFAHETSDCRIKILFAINHNAYHTNRGQSIIARLKNLRGFFSNEADLNQAVSIIVTKQRWMGGAPDAGSVFEGPDTEGLALIGEQRNIMPERAVALGLTSDELTWMSDFLTTLRNQGRIFAFPEPEVRRGSYNYNYDWFPDRGNILRDLRGQPVINPEVNVLAGFSKDDRTVLFMKTVAKHIKKAEVVYTLFNYLSKSTFSSEESLSRARNTIRELCELSKENFSTLKKFATILNSENRLEKLCPMVESLAEYNVCRDIINELESENAYLDLLEKLGLYENDLGDALYEIIRRVCSSLRQTLNGEIYNDQRVFPLHYTVPMYSKWNWEEQIADQECFNACVAFSVVECLQYMHRRLLSQPFLYVQVKEKLGDKKNKGMFISKAMEYANERGVVSREKWDMSEYKEDVLEMNNIAPTRQLNDNHDVCPPLPSDANPREQLGLSRYGFLKTINIFSGIENKEDKVMVIKESLYRDKVPVSIGIPTKIKDKVNGEERAWCKRIISGINERLYGYHDDEERIWNTKPKDSIKFSGWHAITLYGYDESRKVFYFKNSWGTEWMEQGCAAITYSIIGYADEAWIGYGKSIKVF